MDNKQLDALLSILEDIKSNTSDVYDVKGEIENLNRTMKGIKGLLEENNALLRGVIDAIDSIND